MAAALGRRLGGPLRYGDTEENRPLLGDGPRPNPEDVPEAVRIADRAEWAAVGMLCLIWVVAHLKGRARKLP